MRTILFGGLLLVILGEQDGPIVPLAPQQPAAPKEAQDACADPLHHRGNFGVLEIPRSVEDRARQRALGGVHPVQ